MYGSTMTAPLVSGKAQPHERIGYSAKSRPIRAAAVAQTRADFGFGPDAPEDHGHDVAEFPVEAIAGQPCRGRSRCSAECDRRD
jgi:hypothetical protein